MSAGADVIRHHKVAPPHMSVVNRLSMVRHKSRQPMEPQQGESKYANNNNLMEITFFTSHIDPTRTTPVFPEAQHR